MLNWFTFVVSVCAIMLMVGTNSAKATNAFVFLYISVNHLLMDDIINLKVDHRDKESANKMKL